MKRIASIFLLAAAIAAEPAVAHVDVPGLDENGQCVGDADGSGEVGINELILAVGNALNGCARLPITLTFKGMVGDKPFACGTIYEGIGTGPSRFIPTDFRFYVSDVKLITVGGTEVPLALDQDGVWQYQNVALLDFENGCANGNTALNTTVHGSVPAGVYTSVRFTLGLPFDLDHGFASKAPSPLNFTDLFWSWQAGYKFIRVDTGDDTFRIHIGSIGCDGTSPSRPPTSCSRPNLAMVTLSGFSPTGSTIVADLGALLADSNLDVNQPDTNPGCMADPGDLDCVPVFRNLGLNFADGSQSPGTQKFFRLESEPAEEPGHVEFKVASSADGGGKLVAHPTFDTTQLLPIFFDQCFGGSGDDCAGGTRLYSVVNPGIEPIDPAAPDQSLYSVADGTPISLTVTALDTGLSFHLGDAALDSVGATVSLGVTPAFHSDLQAQLMLPGGTPASGTFSATFQLTTSSSPYQSSDPFTVKFTPSAGTASTQ